MGNKTNLLFKNIAMLFLFVLLNLTLYQTCGVNKNDLPPYSTYDVTYDDDKNKHVSVNTKCPPNEIVVVEDHILKTAPSLYCDATLNKFVLNQYRALTPKMIKCVEKQFIQNSAIITAIIPTIAGFLFIVYLVVYQIIRRSIQKKVNMRKKMKYDLKKLKYLISGKLKSMDEITNNDDADFVEENDHLLVEEKEEKRQNLIEKYFAKLVMESQQSETNHINGTVLEAIEKKLDNCKKPQEKIESLNKLLKNLKIRNLSNGNFEGELDLIFRDDVYVIDDTDDDNDDDTIDDNDDDNHEDNDDIIEY